MTLAGVVSRRWSFLTDVFPLFRLLTRCLLNPCPRFLPNHRLVQKLLSWTASSTSRSVFSTLYQLLWPVLGYSVIHLPGITYVKFSKTSEAADALEAMNGTQLGPGSRRIKVMIASRWVKSKRLYLPTTISNSSTLCDWNKSQRISTPGRQHIVAWFIDCNWLAYKYVWSIDHVKVWRCKLNSQTLSAIVSP